MSKYEEDKKFFNFLEAYCGKPSEEISDSFGNTITVFIPVDDCAIGFLTSPNGDIIHIWKVD